VVAPIPLDSSGMANALTVTQLFDSIAIRVDGEKAWAYLEPGCETFATRRLR
jgi:hypothetical protein